MRGNGQFDDWVARARAVPIGDEIHRRRGIELKRVGAEYIGPCPKCGGEDRFAVNTAKGVWNCRGCGKGGDVIELVEHLDDLDFKAAGETLAGPPPAADGKGHPSHVEKVIAEFSYHDRDGNTVLTVERIEFQKPDGTFVIKDGKRKRLSNRSAP